MAESAAERMRTAAILACEKEIEVWREMGYDDKSRYAPEIFGCRECLRAIRALPLPSDPRDDEIAALRAALEPFAAAAAWDWSVTAWKDDPDAYVLWLNDSQQGIKRSDLDAARAALNPTR